MEQVSALGNMAAITPRNKLNASFKTKGILIALSSAIAYAFYTAFMTLAMSKGVWAGWYGENSGLTAFGVMFLLSALGSATTDLCSAGVAMLIAIVRGRFGDFIRCMKTKPGMVMVAAAIIGGPIASTAYVVGLQKAGSIIVPISALCPAIGAILGRFLFKQELNARIMLGIAICVAASFMIGSTSIGDDVRPGLAVGLMFGFVAAFCWGIEGCVCGYGTALIDPEVAITIRQVTSGLSNLIILVPIFGMISDADTLGMVIQAFSDPESIGWFAVAGFAAYFGFMFWYKGTGMCGAALGMSCNGTFSFWTPFVCWIVLGVIVGKEGWSMPPIAWVAAVIMVIGIFTIALNPLDLFKKRSS